MVGDLGSESLKPPLIQGGLLPASMRQGRNMTKLPALMEELLDPAHSHLEKLSDLAL